MQKTSDTSNNKGNVLKRGWTTGACATAAAKSALGALLGGGFADPVKITLPNGSKVGFALTKEKLSKETGSKNFAQATITKDAGDDPDVTHGALISVKITHGKKGEGIGFFAGKGVGIITKPGLPIGVGEPAINPVPRKMISQAIGEVCAKYNISPDFNVTISVAKGEEIAKKTWNPRLGIIGGISILGTSGIVIPYSCSAWIHAIQGGIDVAKAQGIEHLVGCTGRVSEIAAQKYFDLPEQAYIDMGDFVGGMLKYLRAKKAQQEIVKRVTIAGGFAKISKLAQGAMDLHSARSQVDIKWLAKMLQNLGADEKTVEQALGANNGNEVLQISQKVKINLAKEVAIMAQSKAQSILQRAEISVDIIIIERSGKIIANSNDIK